MKEVKLNNYVSNPIINVVNTGNSGNKNSNQETHRIISSISVKAGGTSSKSQVKIKFSANERGECIERVPSSSRNTTNKPIEKVEPRDSKLKINNFCPEDPKFSINGSIKNSKVREVSKDKDRDFNVNNLIGDKSTKNLNSTLHKKMKSGDFFANNLMGNLGSNNINVIHKITTTRNIGFSGKIPQKNQH